VSSKLESVDEIGEADEKEREQGATVPLVIEEDVKMVEGVGVEQVGLVEEEDRVDALLTELLHVRADGVEDRGRGGRWGESERDAELAIEVALSEGLAIEVALSEVELWL
jgi:hypothetical protein